MRTAAKTAFLMAILTLISKTIGFVREMVMAGYYGTGAVTDSYVMATTIPGMIFGGFFTAVATAYMPLFAEKTQKEGKRKSEIFTNEVISLLLVLSAIAAVIGFLLSDQIVSLFAPGFASDERAQITSFYVKVTFCYVAFAAVGGILESYLEYKGTFLPQIFAGYFVSGSAILFIILSANCGYHLLIFGFLIGYAIRLVVLSIISGKSGFRYKPAYSVSLTIKDIALLAIPVFIGSYVGQINLFIDKLLASKLTEGSISALNYSNLIVMLISGLTISIIMTIVYPKLVYAVSIEEFDRFGTIMEKGIITALLIAIPFTFGIMAFSGEAVQIVYERGAFDPTATALTGPALLCYGLGLSFTSVNALLTRGFYSMHNMKSPVICGALGVAINITLNLILINYLQHFGLALATSIATAVNTMTLYYTFRRQYPQIILIRSKNKILKILFTSGISVLVAYALHATLKAYFWMPRILYLGLAMVSAGIIYYLLLKKMKIEELDMLLKILPTGFKRGNK